jgi:hypothetical protein
MQNALADLADNCGQRFSALRDLPGFNSNDLDAIMLEQSGAEIDAVAHGRRIGLALKAFCGCFVQEPDGVTRQRNIKTMENRTHQCLAAELPLYSSPLRSHSYHLSRLFPLRLPPHRLEALRQLALVQLAARADAISQDRQIEIRIHGCFPDLHCTSRR